MKAMLIVTLFGIGLLGPATLASGFDSYSVHLEPARMSTPCDSTTLSSLRDFTHRFRGYDYPGGQLTIRDGRNTDTDVLGGVEWVTSLEHQESIELNGTPAVLVVVFSNHVGGSGSATHLLVVRCRQKRLEVIFEAGGGGIHPSPGRGYSYGADEGLWVTHAIWSPNDSHADPSREIVEVYRWQPKRERFLLVKKHEQPIDTQ
jgi:hypothetical protein